MAAEWICDGCGKREPGVATQHAGWIKPSLWYERNLHRHADGAEDEGIFGSRFKEPSAFDTILTACSRECVDAVAKKTKSHSLVLPV